MNRVAFTLAALSLCCMGLGWRVAKVSALVESNELANCHAVDGDTIVCRTAFGHRERIRLNGIDAPELPGHCRPGRDCAPGDPWLSFHMLEVGMDRGPLTVERIKLDRYGRTIGQVKAGDLDLSCWQLQQGQAIYKPDWDEGGRTARCAR